MKWQSRILPLVIILLCASSQAFGQEEKKTEGPAIARLQKDGVEVRINQLQLQRVGRSIELSDHLKPFIQDPRKFRRTIAISISQSGNGTSVGPTHIELKSGAVLRPILTGNQRFMSVIANSKTPDGFDFTEYWFRVPENIKFGDIFPITMVHTTTNKKLSKIKFKFKGLEP